MKRIIAFVLSLVLILAVTGCKGENTNIENVAPPDNTPEYNKEKTVIEVSENTVSYSDVETFIPGIELSDEDAKAIKEVLESGKWTDDTPDCIFDCTLNLKGYLYNYHSACGSFTEVKLSEISSMSKELLQSTAKSLKLTDKLRLHVNSILDKYVPLYKYEEETQDIKIANTPSPINTPTPDKKEDANMIKINNNSTFTDKLYSLMPKDKNYMYSPFSIKMAFALAANGANGKTKDEIEKALGIGDLDIYNESAKKIIEKYSSQEIIKLNVANSVWINSTTSPYVFDKEYVSDVNKYFHAEARGVNAENAVSEINSWTKDKTGGKIPTIIDNADFHALLLNAVYFKATWQNQFDEYVTKDDIFTDRNGNKTTIPFMNKTAYYSYAKKDYVQIIELPYSTSIESFDEKGKYLGEETLKNTSVSMFILLSDTEITEPEKTVDSLYKNDSFERTYVKLSLPKYKIEYETKLVDTMKALGIVTAFDGEKADFTDMFENGNMYISDAIHKTFIDVDENGTEAAAVTALTMKAMSAAPDLNPVIFRANKPFTFIIRDNISGETLFIGEYSFAK